MPATVREALAGLGTVFATFDHRTQDSGNVSYGIRTPDGGAVFAKTAGTPEPSPGGTPYAARVALLRRTVAVHEAVAHPALLPVRDVLETADGPVVVQDWFPGELLRSPAELREHPDEAGSRFRARPAADIVAALDTVIDLHVVLDRAGWTSGDLYDGCVMYDFASGTVKFIDLECYRPGPYVNDVGRLPGSTRFMAPEEFARGATIDGRTTTFNLGRLAAWFLSRHEVAWALRTELDRATAPDPADRHPSLGAFQKAWQAALAAG